MHKSNLKNNVLTKVRNIWAVVVTQLVERSLPAPEVRGSNPVIGRIFIHLLTINCIEKTNKVYTILKMISAQYLFFKNGLRVDRALKRMILSSNK